MSLFYTHTDPDAQVMLDLELTPSIDPGQDGGRCEPSWQPCVEECEFRVLGVRLLDGRGRVTDVLSIEDGTLPAGAAEALAREFADRYTREDDLRATIDRFVLTMEEVCPS